jgi:hypothetical protein
MYTAYFTGKNTLFLAPSNINEQAVMAKLDEFMHSPVLLVEDLTVLQYQEIRNDPTYQILGYLRKDENEKIRIHPTPSV